LIRRRVYFQERKSWRFKKSEGNGRKIYPDFGRAEKLI
jgi:hypothetical protein